MQAFIAPRSKIHYLTDKVEHQIREMNNNKKTTVAGLVTLFLIALSLFVPDKELKETLRQMATMVLGAGLLMARDQK